MRMKPMSTYEVTVLVSISVAALGVEDAQAIAFSALGAAGARVYPLSAEVEPK